MVHGRCQGSAAQLPVLVAGEATKHAGDHKKIQVGYGAEMTLSWYQGSPLPHQQPEVIVCSLDQILTPLSECWQWNS